MELRIHDTINETNTTLNEYRGCVSQVVSLWSEFDLSFSLTENTIWLNKKHDVKHLLQDCSKSFGVQGAWNFWQKCLSNCPGKYVSWKTWLGSTLSDTFIPCSSHRNGSCFDYTPNNCPETALSGTKFKQKIASHIRSPRAIEEGWSFLKNLISKISQKT